MFGNIFGNNSDSQQQAAPAPNQASGSPEGNSQGAPAGSETPAANPLDAFNSLWENDGKEAPQVPKFSLPAEMLDKAASSLNFTQGIPQEIQDKLASGDPSAMMQALNYVGQQAYKASLQHSSVLTDTFVDARSQFERTQTAPAVRKQLTEAQLSTTPNYSHPVVRNQLNMLADQISVKNPNLAPAQVADMAKQYLSELVSQINPAAPAPDAEAHSPKTDWDQFFQS